jgi:short-subunit dehydrogenase
MRPHETDEVLGKKTPMPPERVARAIVAGVERNRYYIIPDVESLFYARFKGLFPEIFFGLVDGDVARARRRASGR